MFRSILCNTIKKFNLELISSWPDSARLLVVTYWCWIFSVYHCCPSSSVQNNMVMYNLLLNTNCKEIWRYLLFLYSLYFLGLFGAYASIDLLVDINVLSLNEYTAKKYSRIHFVRLMNDFVSWGALRLSPLLISQRHFIGCCLHILQLV